MLQFESWEKLSRTGKHFFDYSDKLSNRGLSYFIASSNTWISLCTVYCIFQQPGQKDIFQAERKRLEIQIDSVSIYLSRAAKSALEFCEGKVDAMRDTVELLETVLFFKRTLLFRNVAAEKLAGLAEISRIVSYAKDEEISHEGDVAEHLYIVKSGSLKIVKVKNSVKSILSILKPGETYGEIGLFSQEPRSASAVANELCQVFVVKRAPLKKLLLEIPEIAYNVIEVFSQKLRKSGEEVALLHTTLSGKLREEIVRA
jgi:hypothetical protein